MITMLFVQPGLVRRIKYESKRFQNNKNEIFKKPTFSENPCNAFYFSHCCF